MRCRRSDVLSSLGLVRLEPSPDWAWVAPELFHKGAQLGMAFQSFGAEDGDVVETCIKEVVSIDWQGISHNERPSYKFLKGFGFGPKFGGESGSGVFNVKVVTLSAVWGEADLVDEVDHCIHDGKKDLLNLFALLELLRVVRDEKPFCSDSSDYSDGLSHLVVEVHPVLGGIVFGFKPVWTVDHVVGELSVTCDLLMFLSDLHSGCEHHLDNFGFDRVERTSFYLFWVQESHLVEL